MIIKKPFLFFLLMFSAFSYAVVEDRQPFFYSAEKNGKTVHLFGTIHSGVPFEEAVCFDKILAALKAADLVFKEFTNEEIRYWTSEEKLILYTGSKEEKEAALSRLSQDSRRFAESRKQIFLKTLKSQMAVQFVDEEKESLESLSFAAVHFLNKRGIEIKENFADILYSLLISAAAEAYFLSPYKMDTQIERTADREDIPIASLDNLFKASDDQNGQEERFSGKQRIEISAADLEQEIKNFEALLLFEKTALNNTRPFYLRGPSAFPPIDDSTRKILEPRHELWMQKILSALENPNYERIFAAVGAAHLLEPGGLPSLLQKEGFAVQYVGCSENRQKALPIRETGRRASLTREEVLRKKPGAVKEVDKARRPDKMNRSFPGKRGWKESPP